MKGHCLEKGENMANLFGAIDVGSHEIELKIFELSRKSGIRQVDDVVHLTSDVTK